ncbi:hypothetical protein GCM10027598_62650 [Amycolatopsis oliviviridis]|uniref:Secreted protein n=1 Tax=Amycolatopsis oliviviridis TaxID=1471590 RepID=A0ABQ3MAF7_9PSEU|nr:hypothetical protein [Amycolatopsis oliviviridis]GHH32987.1 hypothetical protein GCM10017790_70940 [Amycolatopsis oliviviridis]
MTVDSRRYRPARRAVLVLLAAVLTSLGLFLAPHSGDSASADESRGANATVDSSVSKAVAPVRAMGRLAAEPSLLGVHGHGDLPLFGTVPHGPASTTLLRLSELHDDVTPPRRTANRLALGDRAPPIPVAV